MAQCVRMEDCVDEGLQQCTDGVFEPLTEAMLSPAHACVK